MSEHWATFHNCRVDEEGQRVGDVRALCGDKSATSFVFRPEQITCAACLQRRNRLLELLEDDGEEFSCMRPDPRPDWGLAVAHGLHDPATGEVATWHAGGAPSRRLRLPSPTR